jgi:hypothetical protein
MMSMIFPSMQDKMRQYKQVTPVASASTTKRNSICTPQTSRMAQTMPFSTPKAAGALGSTMNFTTINSDREDIDMRASMASQVSRTPKRQPSIWEMFKKYDNQLFDGALEKVKLEWSSTLTHLAGKVYKGKMRMSGTCLVTIRLSMHQLKKHGLQETRATLLYHMIHCWLMMAKNEQHDLSTCTDQFKEKAKEINAQAGVDLNMKNTYEQEGGLNGQLWPIPNPCAKYTTGIEYRTDLAHSIQSSMDRRAWFITDLPGNH